MLNQYTTPENIGTRMKSSPKQQAQPSNHRPLLPVGHFLKLAE